MTAIFISYRRSDTAEHACRLFDRFRSWFPEDEIFFDIRSVDWGTKFPEEIERAIRSAKVVVIVIGPDWAPILNDRVLKPGIDFVRKEVSIALQRRALGEVQVFPALVRDAEMPNINGMHKDLKNELGELFDYQARSFPTNDVRLWDSQFTELLRQISGIDGMLAPTCQGLRSQAERDFHLTQTEPSRRPSIHDVEPFKVAFDVISETLLRWPQEIDGHWIGRPEFDTLYNVCTSNQLPVTVLLGGPGEGKSAILARLGARLRGEDVVLLAIKADQVPSTVASLSELDSWIDCGLPIVEALRRLANDHRVVLLIDQLDALSELMDQRTERLTTLVQLINSVRGITSLHTLVSCREFDFRHDVRFSTLEAKEVSLRQLEWEHVEPLVSAHGFDTSGWSEGVRDVLLTPQHLGMFLDYFSDVDRFPLFENYQGLLSRIIERRLLNAHGARTLEAAETLASVMAEREELWIARSSFEAQFSSELQRLEQEGFLVRSSNELSISFRHQTVFDFLRARAFLTRDQSLAEYVVDHKQQSLFVRPVLWSTLNYLRASDRASYWDQFLALWHREGLRAHVHDLLVNFLGQLSQPDDREAQVLFAVLDSSDPRSKVLLAISGSEGWFTRIESRLPQLLSSGLDQVEAISVVLRRAASFNPEAVLTLVDGYWTHDERTVQVALQVLNEVIAWNESAVETVCKLADHAPQNTLWIRSVIGKISETRSDLAPKPLARYLLARIQKLSDRDLQHFIENDFDWHGIEKLAQRAPRELVEELWPWLQVAFERLAKAELGVLPRYRDHAGLAFVYEGSVEKPLQKAIAEGMSGFAQKAPEEFLRFLEFNKGSDLSVLHHLLSLGLKAIAKQHPQPVLSYLLEDTRRLALGDIHDQHTNSKSLISAVVPNLEPRERKLLEDGIKEWTWYGESTEKLTATERRERRNWIRRGRLNLLSAFPFEYLSPDGRRHVKEEMRVFPESTNEQNSHSNTLVQIRSPMSHEEMARATDDQILGLFEELTDESGSTHPSREWSSYEGGSEQASQEFAEFAKLNPDRALTVLRRFAPGKTEMPAGAALQAMAKDFETPQDLVACVHELHERGFASETFRIDASHCLREIARREDGLDDASCKLLQSWLCSNSSDSDTTQDNTISSLISAPSFESPEHEVRKSYLWDGPGLRTLPHGNYPFLDALMLGYILRVPSEADEWLGVLERHLEWRENSEVWRGIAEHLWCLSKAERKRASAFLESFFASVPEVLESDTGVRLVGKVMDWIPEQLLNRTIDDWISGHWRGGPQAAGEILALRHCKNPEDIDAVDWIERILEGNIADPLATEGLRVGATFTLVKAWSVPALRALTTPKLAQLGTSGSAEVERALGEVFAQADSLPPDDYTRVLLEAMLERPTTLVEGAYFLVQGLKQLLRDNWNPELIQRVVGALVGRIGDDLGNISTAAAANAGEIADIALTLHRIPETRETGLELFERLMEIDSYDLDQRLNAIDRTAFR